MSTDANDEDDIESDLALRVAIDRVILEGVEEDAERVIRVLANVVERCQGGRSLFRRGYRGCRGAAMSRAGHHAQDKWRARPGPHSMISGPIRLDQIKRDPSPRTSAHRFVA